jgi:regulator of RNase E activity RraA
MADRQRLADLEIYMTKIPAVSDALLDELEHLPVAVLSDAMDALSLPSSIMDATIRRLSGRRMVGRVRTVDRAPAAIGQTQADIDPKLGMGTQIVIDSAKPRDVVVVAARGCLGAGIIGDNMATRAKMCGVVGFIVDGAVRDLDVIDELGLNVYANATSPRQGLRRFVTLSVDQAVTCGSVLVAPGDVVVGDGDGVAVLPHAKVTEIVEKAKAIEAVEGQIKTFLEGGQTLVASVEKYKQR